MSIEHGQNKTRKSIINSKENMESKQMVIKYELNWFVYFYIP